MELTLPRRNQAKDCEEAGLLDDERNEYNNSDFTDIEKNIIEKNTKKRNYLTPKFITKRKNCCDNLIYKIICYYKRNPQEKVTQEELKAYYNLKDLALIQYSESNQEHESSLKSLYTNALACGLTENLETPEWKSIGFQVINLIIRDNKI